MLGRKFYFFFPLTIVSVCRSSALSMEEQKRKKDLTIWWWTKVESFFTANYIAADFFRGQGEGKKKEIFAQKRLTKKKKGKTLTGKNACVFIYMIDFLLLWGWKVVRIVSTRGVHWMTRQVVNFVVSFKHKLGRMFNFREKSH